MEQQRRPGVISAIVRIFLVIGLQLVAVFGFVIFQLMVRRSLDGFDLTFDMVVGLVIISALSLFVLSLPIPSFEGNPDWLRLPRSWRFLLGFGIGAVPITLVVNLAIGWVQEALGIKGEQSLLRIFREADDLFLVIVFGVFASVVVPIAEESFFRGFLIRALSGLGTVSAVIISSILFSIAHGEIVALLPTLLLGILFAIARLKSGSIWPGVIAHSINNLIAVLLVRLAGA